MSNCAVPQADPVLRPYLELEDPGSLHLSGLAVDGDRRGRGLGNELLRQVKQQARESGLPRVGLICFEENTGAMKLYDRTGYTEPARRPIVPHPRLHYSEGDAVLLAKEIP